MSFEGFTLPQQVAVTVVPAISGALSVLGSAAIVWMIAKGRKFNNIKYRLLMGICLVDLLSSAMFLVWSLFIPSGTPGVWGAIGNKQTCDAQGVLLNIGTSGCWYNAALAGYYWLSVCHSMSDADIARKYEKWTHLVSILWPVTVAFAALGQDLYGVSPIGCWMTPTPLFCNRDDDVECIRGRHAYAFAWAYVGVPLVLLGGFIAYTMIRIYLYVRKITLNVSRFDFQLRASQQQGSSYSLTNRDPSEPLSETSVQVAGPSEEDPPARRRRWSRMLGASIRSQRQAIQLRQTAWQAFLYLGAYAVSHAFAFLCPNLEVAGIRNPFWTILMQNILYPLQGFLNVFVFLRPRILEVKKLSPDVKFFAAIYVAIFDYPDDAAERLQRHRLSRTIPQPREEQSRQSQESSKKSSHQELELPIADAATEDSNSP